MYLSRTTNFIDIFNIDLSWVTNGVFGIVIGKLFDYAWRKPDYFVQSV